MSKINVARDVMRTLIKNGGMCAVPDKVMPMSEYVRITTKGNRLKMESGNQTASVKAYADADTITEDVSFCVNAKDLTGIVGAITDPAIMMEPNLEAHSVRIVHLGGELSLPSVDASEFPDFEMPGEGTSLSATLPSEVVGKWIDTAKMFVSKDDLRPVMNGMRLASENGTLMCCASDGYVLFYDETVQDDKDTRFSMVIPSGAFQMLSQVIDGTDTFSLRTNGQKAWVTANGITMCVRLVEGRYPNAKSVISSTSAMTASVNKYELSDCLKRISLVASAASDLAVVTFSEDGTVKVESKDLDFSKSAEENLSHTGNASLKVGYSIKYLSKVLSAIDGDKAMFKLNSADKPTVLAEDGTDSRKVVIIMPKIFN